MERNQALAARTAYTVDAALEPINAAAKIATARPRAAGRRITTWSAAGCSP